jgi:hypothetical protein
LTEKSMTDTMPLEKPKKFVNALYLLYLHLAVGVAVFAFSPPLITKGNLFWIVPYDNAFFILGFCLGFILEIRKGKNWARVTFAVLYGIGVSLVIGITIWSPQYSPFKSLLFTLQTIVGLLACMHLVHPDTVGWFKEMEVYGKKRSERRESRTKEALKLKDLDPREAAPTDEALLIVTYNGYKHVWRIIWVGFSVWFLFSIGTNPGVTDTDQHQLVRSFGVAVIWVFFTLQVLHLTDLVLFDQIRLYRDRMVKVRRLIGNIEVDLVNARYLVVRYRYMSAVHVFHRDTSPWARMIKGISYAERLMPSKDVEKLHSLLAALTGRKPEEFDQYSVDMKELMKEKKE